MSGQKCNACSRAVVTEDVYDEFVQRLCAITETLKVADPMDPDAFTGPVVSEGVPAQNKALSQARADLDKAAASHSWATCSELERVIGVGDLGGNQSAQEAFNLQSEQKSELWDWIDQLSTQLRDTFIQKHLTR